MLLHTGQTIHLGVGFIFAPQPLLDPGHALKFEQELASRDLIFTQRHAPPGGLILTREASPLQVHITHQGPPATALSVNAQGSGVLVDDVVDEAEKVIQAYGAAWGEQAVQVIHREVTLHRLFDVAEEHAFQFLWERRLGCAAAQLNAFTRPVLGGGLRFVIPQTDQGPNVDFRIESYFPNAKKLFVEVAMKWGGPIPGQTLPDPAPLIREADRFTETEVAQFITGSVS